MIFPRVHTLLYFAFTSIFATLSLAAAPPDTPSRAPSAENAQIGTLLEELGQTRSPLDAAISPDARFVAWSAKASQQVQLHLSSLPADPARDTGETSGSGVPSACSAARW